MHRHRLLIVSIAALLPCACATLRQAAKSGSTSAVATLRDAAGATIGTVTLTETNAGILLSGSLSGIGSGTHGIHVHTVGRCDPPGFTSAGGHFNPDGRQHGFRNPAGSHVGDLTNLSLPPGGSLTFDLLLPRASLHGDNSLLDGDGSALVVHAAADDYQTDPAGNSGARIACGVIVGR
jgi:Cu-Zn family superoxide dismutase